MLSRFITPELIPLRGIMLHETNADLFSNIPTRYSKLAVISPHLESTVREKLSQVVSDILDFYDITWLRIAIQPEPTSVLLPGIAVVSLCTQRFIKAEDHLYVSVDGSRSLRVLTILEQFLIGQLKNPNPRFVSQPEELLLEFVRMNGFRNLPSPRQDLDTRASTKDDTTVDYRALIDSLHLPDDDRHRLTSVSTNGFDVVLYLVQHELIPSSHPVVRRRTWTALSNENAKIDLMCVAGLIVVALCSFAFNLHTVGRVSQLTIFFYTVTYLYEMLFPDIARYTKPSPRLTGSLALAAGVIGINQGALGFALILIIIGLSSLSIFDDVVDYAIGSIGDALASFKKKIL